MNMQDADACSFLFLDLYELEFAFWHTFAHHRIYVQKLHSRIPLLARYLTMSSRFCKIFAASALSPASVIKLK